MLQDVSDRQAEESKYTGTENRDQVERSAPVGVEDRNVGFICQGTNAAPIPWLKVAL